MRKPSNARIAFGIPLFAGLIWTLSAAVPTSAVSERTAACAVWTLDTIPIHNDRVEVIARYSQPIGYGLTAVFPEDAGVDVISTAPPMNGEPLAVLLTLNTMRAMEGKWMLSLYGDAGECTGDVYVGSN